LHTVDLYRVSRGLFVSFQVTPQILAQSVMVAAMLGIASCLLPAYTALKSRVVDVLKMTE
jgi:hypothetical protein